MFAASGHLLIRWHRQRHIPANASTGVGDEFPAQGTRRLRTTAGKSNSGLRSL
jgi:hypothetical protein